MATKLEQSTRGLNLAGAQTITTGASSAQTAAVVGTYEVLLVATKDCFVSWGANPSASASAAGNVYLLAGEKFWVQLLPSDKVAAIQSAEAGIVQVIPVA